MVRHIFLLDLVACSAAFVVAHLATIGPMITRPVSGTSEWPVPVPYGVATALGVVLWLVSLTAVRSRARVVLGAGDEEYRKVSAASFWFFGLVAVLCYAGQVQLGRAYFALALPLGLALLLVGRWGYRVALTRRRRVGLMSSEVLVVGPPAAADALAERITRTPQAGLRVVGALADTELGDPQVQAVVDQAAQLQVDAVVLAGSAQYESHEVSTLRWALEEHGADLVLAPSLTGIAGPRVHSRFVEGLPLIFVEGAQYSGGMRWVKTLVDKSASAVGLLLISPLLITVAVLIKATSPGPVFFRQERIGLNGEPFKIWKFRSMRQDADSQLMALLKAGGNADTPLFKPVNDPRVTKVGAFIRKWSIDELPQLFNVLAGDMSLVGPRPQVPAEVALYEGHAGRRLMSTPGMAGQWPVRAGLGGGARA